jgi:2,4-dienoyl-CoA reductase-like NADH-dependent reductase (Old Yellow Enzyme family)
MADLFAPLQLRSLTLSHRIAVSPMCQYSYTDGLSNDWHLVHLGSRAIGGAALIIVEAAAVSPEGRITPGDLGIWSSDHIPGLQRVTRFLHEHGSFAAIQLAHAGRKASMALPWDPVEAIPPSAGGWDNVLAPSPIPYADNYAQPHELDLAGIQQIVEHFAAATRRALAAGFDAVEIHAAHGYLLHEFLSPLSNQRTDQYGGSFENRTRLLIEVIRAVRANWPQHLPLLVRISATDWSGGDPEANWSVTESVALARLLKSEGVDLIDVSSGGNDRHQKIDVVPSYQVPFAGRIRREANIPTAAVGLITDPAQAEEIVTSGKADLVLLAREFLRDPYWPLHAAQQLGKSISWPKQYLRAAPPNSPTRQSITHLDE